jgi:hypothetical protein
MSVANAMHTTIAVHDINGKAGCVDLEDCLLETMTGCGAFVVGAIAA